MCFVKQRAFSEPLIAKKDIICYKTLAYTKNRKQLASVYQGFIYELGANYFEDSFKSEVKKSIKNKQCALYNGMHSFTSIEQAMLRFGPLVVKCIIPEGSLYYKNNKLKEYISDNLTIVEVIYEKPGYTKMK